MKKLSVVLALLLVAALVFGGVTFSQKGDLQKQLDAKVTELTKAKDDAVKAAQDEASQAAAALEEKITALTGEKDEALKEAETAKAAVTDLEGKLATAAQEMETKLAAAAQEAEAQLTTIKDEATAAAQEALDALTAEKDEAVKALAAAQDNVSSLEGQVKDLTNLLSHDYHGKTIILHTNDVHGAIDGYAYIPTLRNWFTTLGAAKVLVVDVGDYSQGSTYVSSTSGLAAVEMMNAAHYDLVTPGNHEFDFGYAQFMENLSKAEFDTICANVILDETGKSILDPYRIIEGETGLKIGFVGLETPETATKVNPGLIKEISFTTFDDLYTCAQDAVNAVKEEGVDLVIGLFHLGVDSESATNGYRSIDVLNKVTGFDFVIDGHSHTVMTEGENGEPIQSTGTKFANIGVIVIDNETKKIEDNFLYNTAGIPKDPEVLAKAQAIMDEVDAKYQAVFATSEVELNGAKAPGNRTEETNLGDLITDAMVWSVLKEGGIEQVETNQVVGITNGGGIRAAIPAGDVTMSNINTVLPFGNTVAVIYVTGEELLEVLEASTFCTPDSIGGYPQTSGIEWVLDTTKPFDKGEVYTLDGKEGSYFKPASIQRVTITAINGVPFDPSATYAVVTNNFCAAGGDTYNAFARAYSEGSGFDTGIPLDEAVMAYVKDVLNGAITAEAYGAPRGNATQIK